MRITLSTLSSNEIFLPGAQVVSSAGSFESVFAKVSTDDRADSRSTNEGLKDARTDKPDARSEDATASATTDEAVSDDQSTASTVSTASQDGDGTSDATVAESSTVTDAAAGTVEVGATSSQAVVSSFDRYVPKGITAASLSEAVSGGVGSAAAKVSATASGTVSLPTKQDRSKPQTDVKSSTQASAVVAVLDQSKIQTVNLVGWQPSPPGVEQKVFGDPKDGAAGTSSKTQRETATALDGATVGISTTAIVPDSAPGSEPAALANVPDGMTEGAFGSLMLTGVAGATLVANEGGLAVVGESLQKGEAAPSDSTVVSVGIGVSGSKGASAGAGDSPLHTAADGNQPTQTVQPDISKLITGTTIRAAEAASIQGTAQLASHNPETSQHPTGATSGTSPTATEDNLPAAEHLVRGETVVAFGINSAKIIQTMGQTEMHVGMHSEEFGDISIRTSLSQQQMVMQISLAHNDLSQAISTHLSTVQAKLGEEYGLHASIEINNQGAPLPGGQGNSSQRDQQSFARSTKGSFVASSTSNESGLNVVAFTSAGSGHGLDIRV